MSCCESLLVLFETLQIRAALYPERELLLRRDACPARMTVLIRMCFIYLADNIFIFPVPTHTDSGRCVREKIMPFRSNTPGRRQQRQSLRGWKNSRHETIPYEYTLTQVQELKHSSCILLPSYFPHDPRDCSEEIYLSPGRMLRS